MEQVKLIHEIDEVEKKRKRKREKQIKKLKKYSWPPKKSTVPLDTVQGISKEEPTLSQEEHLEFKESEEEFVIAKRGEQASITLQAYDEMRQHEIERIQEYQAE